MSLYYTGYSAEPADPRPPALAGGWYPAGKKELDKLVTGFLSAVKKPDLPGEPACLIVPHAGYAFSGSTAAAGFKAVEGKTYSRVVLLGPSHYMGRAYVGGAVPTVKAFATPLGEIPLDRDACEKLTKARHFTADDRPHRKEHCLEIELPLLQKTVKGLKIVPVLIGNANGDAVAEMAAGLRTIVDDKTLLVVSTDFTHYGPNYGYVPFRDRVPERLRDLDGAVIDRILAVDRRGFVDLVAQTGATVCGRWAVALALETLAGADVEGVAVSYTTSGALTKDYTNSVSYASIALCRGAAAPLSESEQQVLLKLARDQVRQYLADGSKLAGVEGKYKL
ncbi:MAG: AmmeMemoRadiSam system protein B, partial [Planctomycetota bacterium]